MIDAGLTMAIANPNQMLLMNTALSCNLLLNREEADLIYIERMNRLQEEGVTADQITAVKKADTAAGNNALDAGSSTKSQSEADSKLSDKAKELKAALMKGKKDSIVRVTNECLEAGEEASFLLNEALIPGINEVGDLFEKGKYFLPQLISSAEAMKKSIEYLEPMLQDHNATEEMPTVLIATVEGDIHDIGKNLVALMLKNYGFRVIDLGKDVKGEAIIEAAKEHKASVIALSALMTTTMLQMKQIIELKEKEQLDVKVIIGGAVITQDYADEIGADGYAKDAQEAVKLTQRLLNI